MRKVLFKKFIPIIWVDPDGNECPKRITLENSCYSVNQIKIKPGTNKWEDEFTHPGFFHAWGYESEDRDVVDTVDSYGIIELPDGTIELINPRAIKFVEPPKEVSRYMVHGVDIKKYFKHSIK